MRLLIVRNKKACFLSAIRLMTNRFLAYDKLSGRKNKKRSCLCLSTLWQVAVFFLKFEGLRLGIL
ncbi:hypothetical protein AL523_18180 [Enterococcus gallinarum]|nr:hypothetical protein CXM95_06225 [Enterococcus sp. CR-Ec1]AVC42253.1 hypothetical protein AL523_18180 [Enterococcus gallinarum]MBO1122073.1 hypothetical protein [Enterococcus casseliflavus]TPE03780.1 hypothetical protein FJP08_09610 [Enterococcus sp. PF-3]